ncbi:MAG: hypothetical protein WC866_00945 [Patescibacteria group bacterium]|jgi:hypothetical protein
MKKLPYAVTLVSAALLLVGAGCGSKKQIESFEDCAAAGNPVMESYPRQCRADGKTFVEKVSWVPGPGANFPVNAELGEAFTLQPGQSRGIDGGIRLTLLEINDSRCPKDVQCIWAGELSAHFKLEGPEDTAPIQEFSLGTARNGSVELSGFTFTLKDASEALATVIVTY